MKWFPSLAVSGALALSISAHVAEAQEVARACLTPAETREAAFTNNFSDPVVALRTAAAHAHAEALRSRLCRWNEEFVYEITLLRRDGKVIKVLIKAVDGTLIGARSNP